MSGRRDATRVAAAALLRGDASAGPHLVVTGGAEAGRRIALGDDQTLGRGRRADVRLADPAASRLHARLLRAGDGWAAEDLGSRNGLRINGRRCRRRRPLLPGDELSIGDTRLKLSAGSFEEETPRVGREPARGRALPPAAAPLAVAAALAALAALLLAAP